MAEKHVDELFQTFPQLFSPTEMPSGFSEWDVEPIDDPTSLEPSELEGWYWELRGHGGDESGRLRIPPIPVEPGQFGGAFDPDSALNWRSRGKAGEPPPPDAWAFYLPFHHFHMGDSWGIYLIPEGVLEFTDLLLQLCGHSLSWQIMMPVCRKFLYYHELYHHKVEAFATRLEVTHRKPLYIDQKQGFESLYSRTCGTDDCLEESLANAYAFSKITAALAKDTRKHRVLQALQHYIRISPPGYKMGVNYLSQNLLKDGENAFAEENHVEAKLSARSGHGIWNSFGHSFDPFIDKRSRVNYLIPRSSHMSGRTRLRRL